MKVRIARTVRDAIIRDAERNQGVEVCGLLIGRDGLIEAAVPAANVAPDQTRTFEIDPAVLLAEHRRARDSGRHVVGHYHSHPGGRATPSLRDAANALQDGALWLIIGKAGVLAGFCANPGGEIAGRFDPVDLEVV